MIIVNLLQNDSYRNQPKLPDSYKVKWDDWVILISIKKTVRITLMCGRGGRQVGVKSSSPFSFYPAASCPYHRYWVDIMVVEFVGYYQAQFLWNFQEWCSKSIHFFIDLSINKENLWQPRLDCPCSPTIC